jgi:hypothetical protein
VCCFSSAIQPTTSIVFDAIFLVDLVTKTFIHLLRKRIATKLRLEDNELMRQKMMVKEEAMLKKNLKEGKKIDISGAVDQKTAKTAAQNNNNDDDEEGDHYLRTSNCFNSKGSFLADVLTLVSRAFKRRKLLCLLHLIDANLLST